MTTKQLKLLSEAERMATDMALVAVKLQESPLHTDHILSDYLVQSVDQYRNKIHRNIDTYLIGGN